LIPDGDKLLENRLRDFFFGLPLNYLAFAQFQDDDCDSVIAQNGNGELRFEYPHAALFAITEITPEGRSTHYEVREKGSHKRHINMMMAETVGNQPGSGLQEIGRMVEQNESVKVRGIRREDIYLKTEEKSHGRIVHLGAMIR